MEKNWSYCPKCGFRAEMRIFDDIFERMNREIRNLMNGPFEGEAMDISPYFRKPVGTGFSIRISQSTGRPPQVSVRTFGDVDRGKVEKAVLGELGMSPSQAPGSPRQAQVDALRKRARQIEREDTGKMARAKHTEEPKADVRRTDGTVTVDMELPGVKSPDDIHVRELENSVEVKAIAGEKAYFKIVTKPPQARLAERNFSNGVLHLEFS